MIKFAIRDDDTSYFTRPEELDSLYSGLPKAWPISLALIPFSVETFHRGDRQRLRQTDIELPLGNNTELTRYLIEELKSGHFSVMLHGYNHKYYKRNDRWFGEYRYGSYDLLFKRTKTGLDYLNTLLGYQIKTFVPPSNDIGPKGVKAISDNGLNLSGTIYLSKRDRPLTTRYFYNYLLKSFYRLRYKKQYPFVQIFENHKEMISYGIVPGVSWPQLKSVFDFCYSRRAPFCLSTHYWEANRYPKLKDLFYQILYYAEEKNCRFVKLDDLVV